MKKRILTVLFLTGILAYSCACGNKQETPQVNIETVAEKPELVIEEVVVVAEDATNYKELSTSGNWISQNGDATVIISEESSLFTLTSLYGCVNTDNMKKDFDNFIIGNSMIPYYINETALELTIDGNPITFKQETDKAVFDEKTKKIKADYENGVAPVPVEATEVTLVNTWANQDGTFEVKMQEDNTAILIRKGKTITTNYMASEDTITFDNGESYLYMLSENELKLFRIPKDDVIVLTPKV